jgi:Flp pilus assembly protein TadD
MRVGVAGLVMAGVLAMAPPSQAQMRDTLAGAYLAGSAAAARGDATAAAKYFASALLRDPQNPAIAEQAMVHQLIAGQMGDAERTAEKLARLVPAHRIANIVLVVREFRRGGFEAARKRVADAGDGFHPLIAGLLEAWAAYGQGDRTAALAALDGLGGAGLQGAFAGFHRGLMLTLTGDGEGALAALENVRTGLGARSARMIEAEAIALELLGRREAAEALYGEFAGEPALATALTRLQSGQPARPLVTSAEQGAAEALFGLAGLLTGDNDRRAGIAHARLAVHLRPDLDAAVLMIAGLFIAEDQHELAAQTFALIPAESPGKLRAEIGRAEALQALDRRDEARAVLEALRTAHPENPSPHVALGDLLRRGEDWVPCAEAYGDAVELLVASGRIGWALYYQRGICFERAGVWDRAEADFKAALALEAEQPLVLNYLGYSWVEQGRNLEEAKAMIERAVAQRPEDGYITDSLGWVLYRMGDYDGAVEWLEKAVELTPTDPVINDHLGDALWKVGRRLEARFQWRRARSFEPTEKDLARINRKLDVGLDVVLEEERAQAAAAVPGAAPVAPAPVPNGG